MTMEEQELDTGRIVANVVARSAEGGQVLVTDDGRLIVCEDRLDYWDYGALDLADEEEVKEALEGMFDRDEYIRVMSLLGMQATVNL